MELRLLKEEELQEFINGIQEAFQQGYESYFGKCEQTIIPVQDIMVSYNAKGSKSYVMEGEGKIIGGAIIVINEDNHNELHILYTKVGVQNKGVGFKIWETIEKLYPETKVWTTCTPYFDERNINFYVNKCHFHIVEFINRYHGNDKFPEEFIGDAGEGMFEFEKVMPK